MAISFTSCLKSRVLVRLSRKVVSLCWINGCDSTVRLGKLRDETDATAEKVRVWLQARDRLGLSQSGQWDGAILLLRMAERPLTILEITHAGHQAGSTFMIHSLCAPLARRGHRVLVGCRPDSLLAQLSADAGLPVVPFDFRRLTSLAASLARVIAREHVDLINSHDTRDRRALTWLRWQRRLPEAFVVTRHTMPLTSPAELLAVGLSVDRTIAVSHAVARALRRRLYPAGRLRVVTNGIDVVRLDAPSSEGDMAAARAALGDPGGRPVVLVLARRKDQ